MVKREVKTLDGAVTGWRMRHQLGDHRIIEHRDLAAFLDTGINAYTVTGGFAVADELPYRREKAPRGIFGIDPCLYCPSIRNNILLGYRQLFASGHTDHLLDKIQTIDHFSDRMFHLQSCVHLQKIEILVSADDKFHRAGRPVVHRLRKIYRLAAHCGACFRRNERTWRFLNHLLVASLDRTFALANIDDVAMLVCKKLDFNMTRLDHEFLDEDA